MQRELNEQQKKAVSLFEGPALVLAGAGSGKTRVVTERIAQLIRSGVNPDAILGLTFTNKAAKEMQERVHKLCSCAVWISTFHRLGARMLRESIAVLGYQPNFLILDEEDADKVIKSCLEKLGVLEGKGDKKRFRQEISKQKNAEGIRESHELPNGLYAIYCEELKRLNAVDFDDLLLLPLKILREHPSVLEIYRERWQYLLVDEYQDTNGVQDQLIQLLVGDRKNLFVVGDPDQAIYSWRGANIKNILEFERCYPGAEVIRLEQNYRSQSHILDAANALISHNEARYKKNLWSTRGAGSKLKKIRAGDEKEEAFKIAEMISSKRVHGVPYREMAVLYRTNAQSRPFEDQLLARGVPYIVVGGISFYQRKEIKDILAFLRLLVSEQDPISFERTVLLRKQGLGLTSLKKILQGALEEGMAVLSYAKSLVAGAPLSHTVSLPKRAKEALSEYCKMMERLKAQTAELGVCEILRAVIDESQYFEFLRGDPETYQDRRENVDELVAKAAEWDAEERGGLVEFFEELSLKSNLDADVDAEIDRLSLMTVHNSKGLEFDVVFLSGLEEDLFPHVNSRGSESALEEERRLCYVAMTRAREELVLSYCLMRYLFGTERYQTPSRFLREIPQHYFGL